MKTLEIFKSGMLILDFKSFIIQSHKTGGKSKWLYIPYFVFMGFLHEPARSQQTGNADGNKEAVLYALWT